MVFVELKTVVIKTLIEVRRECMNKVRMSTEIENRRKYQTEIRAENTMCAQMLQLCLTLCNSVDCSPPGSSVHGILQAGILEWVAISFLEAALKTKQTKNR